MPKADSFPTAALKTEGLVQPAVDFARGGWLWDRCTKFVFKSASLSITPGAVPIQITSGIWHLESDRAKTSKNIFPLAHG
jgi:hypothetical protein